LFYKEVDRLGTVKVLIHSPSPQEEDFARFAAQQQNPAEFLQRCWATGKVPHRELVVSFLRDQAVANPYWFKQVDELVLAGTVDPDMSVREIALAILDMGHDPRLFDSARAQLSDVDPLIRQLGLDHLRRLDGKVGVPVVIPLLEDSDLQIEAGAEVALSRWSGQDFGVRIHDAIPFEKSGVISKPANLEGIRRGVQT